MDYNNIWQCNTHMCTFIFLLSAKIMSRNLEGTEYIVPSSSLSWFKYQIGFIYAYFLTPEILAWFMYIQKNCCNILHIFLWLSVFVLWIFSWSIFQEEKEILRVGYIKDYRRLQSHWWCLFKLNKRCQLMLQIFKINCYLIVSNNLIQIFLGIH